MEAFGSSILEALDDAGTQIWRKYQTDTFDCLSTETSKQERDFLGRTMMTVGERHG